MQSTENTTETRLDLNAIQAHIDSVVSAIPGGETREVTARGEGADDRLRFLIQTLAALAAERDRADRFERMATDAQVREDDFYTKWQAERRRRIEAERICRETICYCHEWKQRAEAAEPTT